MNCVSLKEAALLPIKIAATALTAFGLFKATQGERAPVIFPVLAFCTLATQWIVMTTNIV